jgi:hypothetical protein
MSAIFRMAVALAMLAWSTARAEPVIVPVTPGLDGWSLIKVPGRTAAAFTARDDILTVAARRGVGFLYRPLPSGVPRILSWQWRIDRGIAPTDPSARGRDDRALALHVWSPRKDGGEVPLRQRLAARMAGAPPYGRGLTYMWGGTRPPGTAVPNVYMPKGQGQVIVCRGAEAPEQTWMTETVDLAADFAAAFGAGEDAPAFLAVSADTDDAGGDSVAHVANITFRSSAEAAATCRG